MGFAKELLAAARAFPLDDHPFFTGLAGGHFPRESFGIYLSAMYPMVHAFPRRLARLLADCRAGQVRCHLLANILEEEGIEQGPGNALVRRPEKSHTALFERALTALGMDPRDVDATPTRTSWFDQQLDRGQWFGPAAYIMVGFEGNVPRTYRRLLTYLTGHCGFTESEAIFFHEHIEADQDHAAQGAALIELAAQTEDDRRQALEGAHQGGRTWMTLHRMLARDMRRASQAATAP